MKLEDSLNGGYPGLYGEIVDKDVFHFRNVADIVSCNDPNEVHEVGHKRAFDFEPTLCFDIGANLGVVSRYVRLLFPNCRVVAVEPFKDNVKIFEANTNDDRILLINAAIGNGPMYMCHGARNGAQVVYVSKGPGYSEKSLLDQNAMIRDDIGSIMLPELGQFIGEGQKTILKMDIEGNESCVLAHKPSLEFLKKIDYFVIEMHWYAYDADQHKEMVKSNNKALAELSITHNTRLENNYFYAVKK